MLDWESYTLIKLEIETSPISRSDMLDKSNNSYIKALIGH
jgi:hypothetical protein